MRLGRYRTVRERDEMVAPALHRLPIFAERDIVWTVQLWLHSEIERQALSFSVFNDHTLIDSPRASADLVILEGNTVAVAAEFKYEPHPGRSTNRGGDIWHKKLPVLSIWAESEKDVERARSYINQGKAMVAYSMVIDEGGRHNWRTAPAGSEWLDWGDGRWALWSKWQ